MRYFLICALLSLALTQAGAATAADVSFQPLASITNDRNTNLQSLGILVDGGRVVVVRVDSVNGNHPHVSDFTIDAMKSGAVLDGDANHGNIVLRGSIDSTVGSADLVITYLQNGLLGKHRDCRASLVRDESGQWHLVNIYDHSRVDHLVVKTWRLGISRIEGICPR